MTDAVWTALSSVLGTGLFGLVGAILLGKLVPVSQLERAEKEADTWRATSEQQRQSLEQKDRLLERSQLSAEITDKVMQAIEHRAGLPGSAASGEGR